jgi:flagellar hook assembly protein FlgD
LEKNNRNGDTASPLVLQYDVPVPSAVLLGVYTILGCEVFRIRLANKEAGKHTLEWDGRDKLGELVPDRELIIRVETISNDGGAVVISAKKLMLNRDTHL